MLEAIRKTIAKNERISRLLARSRSRIIFVHIEEDGTVTEINGNPEELKRQAIKRVSAPVGFQKQNSKKAIWGSVYYL